MKHKCAFCQYQTDDIVACGQHYETAHRSLLPTGLSGAHFAYFILTGRKEGRCVVCHRPTQWNEKTHKYHRICSDRCKRQYGKIKQLTNPKVQQEMLAHRKISGEYTWFSSRAEDSSHPIFRYTGSYELDFVTYMDRVKHWNPNDLMMPCPILFEYTYDGQKRFYIPDAYIPSLDLIIEIKDGDPNNPPHNANKHPEILAVNRVKEKLKRAAVKKSTHNYLVIYNKDYRDFEMYLRTTKKQYLTESIDDIVDTVADELSKDIKSQLMDFIDAWKAYVKEHKLESYCKTSMRLNTYVYNAINSEKFDDMLATAPKRKDLISDLLTVGTGYVQCIISIMDTDDDIKLEMGDPYAIYSSEYTNALAKLMKWKKPRQFTYLGRDTSFEFDEDATKQLVIQYEDSDD